MGTTLDNGTYLPDEGERNCYDGLAGNWVALDNHLGSTNIHVTINDKQAWNGHVADTTIHVTSADKQAWNGHVADSVKHVTAEDKEAWNGKADASALTAHTGDTTIHVTAEDKQAWNGKADASALTAHTGDTTIHVTAEDKAKWDAVTSKADDSDVVHKSGNETIGGNKTFSSNVNVYNSDSATDTANIILKNSKYSRGSTTEVDAQYIRFLDKNAKNCGQLSCYGQSSGNTLVSLFAYNTSLDNQTINSYVTLLKASSGYSSFYANIDNATSLGETNKKWADVQTYKVNGLEPSSLSLPSDRSARIDISSYFTNLGNGNNNSYNVPANGYIYLYFTSINSALCFSQTPGGLTNYAQSFSRYSGDGQLYVFFPVRKGDNFIVKIYTSSTAEVQNAFFIPCRGNV